MGNCYEVAGKIITDLHLGLAAPFGLEPGGSYLVHAVIIGQGKIEGERIGHAWVEDDNHGLAIDISNGRELVAPIPAFHALARLQEMRRYSPAEAARFIFELEHWGPWHITSGKCAG
jgi:hypothetical protein